MARSINPAATFLSDPDYLGLLTEVVLLQSEIAQGTRCSRRCEKIRTLHLQNLKHP
jgi:hypothetical protein